MKRKPSGQESPEHNNHNEFSDIKGDTNTHENNGDNIASETGESANDQGTPVTPDINESAPDKVVAEDTRVVEKLA